MKNKIKIIVFLIISANAFFLKLFAQEPFIFEVEEINISKNATFFSSDKRGEIKSDDGLKIISDKFNYDKSTNILNLYGNITIYDKKNDISISSNKLIYFKNDERFFSEGKTKAHIYSKYTFESFDVLFNRKEMFLTSSNNSIIYDNYNNKYESSEFKYLVNESLLKAKNIFINYKNDKSEYFSDKFFFKDAFINLENQNFISNETLIEFHKDIFDRSENDPRISSISSNKNGKLTTLSKAIFTSCKKNDNCPPWSIKANKIIHDKTKKQLIYDKALLQIYDVPILYFPKFFHPDPSVKRQSGLLKPLLNKSNIIGSSLQLPYYKVLSENRDLTFKPTFFNNNLMMLQNEFRQENKFSSFIADVALIKGYNSSSQLNKKKNINHFFSRYDLDLNLPNFEKSNFFLKTERVNNDNYLKVFEGNLSSTNKLLLPTNKNKLSSEAKIEFYKNDSSFISSINVFEDLASKNSDRYQYIFPRFEFKKNSVNLTSLGFMDFRSLGDNNLKNTNNLTSRLINDFSFKTYDIILNSGFVNNFGIYFKNLNSIAKNDQIYKDKLQMQLMSIAEFQSSMPLIKSDEFYNNTLTPKFSLRFNPGDMKNYSTTKKKINYSNIYSINRLALEDSFESGKSLTLGFDFKKENIENINNFFEASIAKVFRDKNDKNIPVTSAIDKKNSNYFGSLNYSFDNLIDLNYNFSINNDLNALEYSDIELKFVKDDFFIELNYLEENKNIGNEHFIENTFGYDIDENNFLKFKTRRNKKINLTEFYDLIYEYKNDCLTAGINYKKTFYNDRDVKPSEDLMFTITLFPLTTFEQSINN